MTMKKTALTAGLAIGAVLLSTAASLAAYATGSVNVRRGPGLDYGVVDQLRRGEWVDIDRCIEGWCRINHSGPDGWVSARYLTRDAGFDDGGYWDDDDRYDDGGYWVRPGRPGRPMRPYRPWRDPRAQVCVGGPNASFCISD